MRQRTSHTLARFQADIRYSCFLKPESAGRAHFARPSSQRFQLPLASDNERRALMMPSGLMSRIRPVPLAHAACLFLL